MRACHEVAQGNADANPSQQRSRPHVQAFKRAAASRWRSRGPASRGLQTKLLKEILETQHGIQKEISTLRTLMGGVSEAADWPEFTVRGVHGGGATLQTLGDVRRLVLPAAIKGAMRGKPELVDAVNGAVLEPLLDKDAGFLRALEVLFGGEGAPENAAAMRGLLNRRCGLVDEEDKEDVRSRMVALLEARGDKLPLGLAADLGLMFRYLAGSPEQRRDLLAGGLFVRCAAALLCGSYTGFLEVDAGAAGGCEVNSITRSLLINIGQIEMNLAGVAPAQQQLANVGKVAAFTLDRALAAVRSAARAPRQVQELPVRLCVQGVVLYAEQATRMQQQAEVEDKLEELDGQILSKAPGGLASATLVLSVASARGCLY